MMSVELVHVIRGNKVESIHRGDIVIVNQEKKILKHIGDPNKKTFWRSAAKPFQVLPFVEAGGIDRYNIESHELALMCSSHGGEKEHVETARSILRKIGLDESFLDCGKSRPMYEGAYRTLLRANEAFLAVHNPCSGKHSGMLALAQLMGIDTENYIKEAHPVQQMMIESISKITQLDKSEIEIAIDGCGVPVFGLTITDMAFAFSQLAGPYSRFESLKPIAEAMIQNPFYVAGTKRLDTILMEETNGKLVAKLGAESVYCVGLMGQGKAMAMKIEDGNYRALDALVPKFLNLNGFIDDDEYEKINKRLRITIANHRKETIGYLKVVNI